MKLQYKILLAFVACFALAFSGLLFMINPRLNALNQDLTTDLSLQIVEARAGEIGEWMIQRVNEAQIIARMLNSPGSDTHGNVPGIINAINGQLRDAESEKRYTIAFADNDGIVELPENRRIAISEREYFQSALATSEAFVISKALVSLYDGARAVIVCCPVSDEDGDKVGYLLNQIPLRMLTEVTSSINIYDASVWVMDRYGRIIARDGRFNGEHAQNPENYFLNKTATSIYASGIGTLDFPLDDKTDGQLLYASIPNTDGWHLCVLATQEAMYAKTNSVIRSVMLIWIALIGVSVFLSAMISVSVVKPVNQLSQVMQRVGLGDLTVRFQSKGGDEIAHLGDGLNQMLDKISRLMDRVYSEQQSKRNAELRVLQSQINPHFLYNTLDTLVWKASEHHEMEIADILSALSSFFRVALSKGCEFIPLRQEIEHVYSYLFIQQVRYSDRLNYDISVEDESLYEMPVLKLILQPLIENAIYHGIKPMAQGGLIQLVIRLKDGLISMSVIDNGVGMTDERLSQVRECLSLDSSKAGFGLYNVNARLRLAYGDKQSLSVNSERGKGTSVEIMIPVSTDGISANNMKGDGQIVQPE